MNTREFPEFLRHHRANFPGMGAWLERLDRDAQADDTAPAAKEIMARWGKVLADVSLEDAKAASDTLAAKSGSERHYYERHAAELRDVAHGRRREQSAGSGPTLGPRIGSDGVETFRCPICRDYGRVTVWHPATYRAVWAGTTGEPGSLAFCCVACSCRTGDKFARQLVWRFNPRTMLPIPWGMFGATRMELLPELIEFLAHRWQGQRQAERDEPRAFSEFDQFAEFGSMTGDDR